MKWEDYRPEFDFDGSWRDIYVLNTSISQWQLLIEFFHSGPYNYSYQICGEESKMPSQASDIFAANSGGTVLLSVRIGSIMLNCHFFRQEEIEFDLDPREVRDECQAKQIFAFMRQIGHALQKEVILTPENGRNLPIFKFVPANGELRHILCE